MTMEAAAGKNPVSHVGKLYNVAARLIAQDVLATLPGIGAAECTLVSRISAPIDQPQVMSIRLRAADGRPTSEYAAAAEELGRDRLTGLASLSELLISGELTTY